MESKSLSKIQKTLIGVGAFVLVFLAAYVLWVSRVPHNALPIKTTNVQRLSSTTEIVNTPQGSYKVEQIDIAEVSKAPQIQRPLTFNGNFTDEQKTAIQATANVFKDRLLKNPKDAGAWTSLGTVRKIVGDYEGARLAWEYVIKLSPKNSTPLYNLADLYGNFLKKYSTAESYYLKVIAIDPQDTNSYRDLFNLYSSVYKKDTAAAENILKQGIAAAPDAVDLHILLARYYKAAGRVADAKAQYDAAIASATAQKQNDLVTQIQQEEATLK